ncbi:MAG: hypothetical protein A3G13_03015 [Candidatus Levybacteria bacterium RIFCSPLOWO2_12_FULL_37_7]|nr:MAG: hypothetical protein A3G13_03015 [Candidatus Levybacteria bacterium RIFCSPLOWO2_12_FULL_37_7]
MSRLKFIIFTFFLWRILLFLPLLAAELFMRYRTEYAYTSIFNFTIPQFPLASFLLHPWANFDGLHYLFIAGNGYTNNFGFFPLYPILISAFSSLFGSEKPFEPQQFFSGFFISNIALFLSLFTFYKLLEIDYSKYEIKRSILFLLLFPTAFFFASLYSESLFLLVTLLSFYFARQQKWFLAGIFAGLASLTRIVGIFLLPALLYEFCREKTDSRHSGLSRISLFSLFFPLVSLTSYAYLNFLKTGDWLYFIHAQGNFGNNRTVSSIVLFPQTVVRYGKILLTLNPNQYEWLISLLELSTFFFASILLYIAWKKKVRTSYLVFSVLSFLLPVSTGTFTALPRYVLILFPIFIALGMVKHKWVQRIYVISSAIILFLLLMFFSKGYFVA